MQKAEKDNVRSCSWSESSLSILRFTGEVMVSFVLVVNRFCGDFYMKNKLSACLWAVTANASES